MSFARATDFSLVSFEMIAARLDGESTSARHVFAYARCSYAARFALSNAFDVLATRLIVFAQPVRRSARKQQLKGDQRWHQKWVSERLSPLGAISLSLSLGAHSSAIPFDLGALHPSADIATWSGETGTPTISGSQARLQPSRRLPQRGRSEGARARRLKLSAISPRP